MTRRVTLVLLILAALCGAPSSVLAAPSGGSPESGTGDLLVLLGIVVGVAAVALLATGWMLATRGRDDEPEAAHAARIAASGARRARQRTRVAGHDPVLAAMGLEEDDLPNGRSSG